MTFHIGLLGVCTVDSGTWEELTVKIREASVLENEVIIFIFFIIHIKLLVVCVSGTLLFNKN